MLLYTGIRASNKFGLIECLNIEFFYLDFDGWNGFFDEKVDKLYINAFNTLPVIICTEQHLVKA